MLPVVRTTIDLIEPLCPSFAAMGAPIADDLLLLGLALSLRPVPEQLRHCSAIGEAITALGEVFQVVGAEGGTPDDPRIKAATTRVRYALRLQSAP